MRFGIGITCVVVAAVLMLVATRAARAQEEVVHPGETYDGLQAGQDAYAEAEAQRRAVIGRQLMLEEQIQAENTWSDPQDKYRPVRPESYGPIRPRVYAGPTLADVYAYPRSAVVFYNAPPGAPAVVQGGSPAKAAPVPVFEPWPQVPGDIWGTPYYGYVRQPIGHVKIWTGRASYIYKPIYASPVAETAVLATPPAPARPRVSSSSRSSTAPQSPNLQQTPPPPPRPSLGRPDGRGETPKSGDQAVPPPANGARQGQEI